MAHGPKVPTIRSVLFALSVRMDESGEAFPSQRKLAADTALSERTVREALLEARRQCWVAVNGHLRPGQAWRLSYYVACVPDHLNLANVNLGRGVDLEMMSDQSIAQHGEADDRLHGTRPTKRSDRAKPRKAKGAAKKRADAIAARSKAKRYQGAATDVKDVRQLTAQGAATDSRMVRTPSPTKYPSKFPFEVPIEEGHALARTTPVIEEMGNREEYPDGYLPIAASTDSSATPPLRPEGLASRKPSRESGLLYIEALVTGGDDPIDALRHAQRARYPVTESDLRELLVQRGAV